MEAAIGNDSQGTNLFPQFCYRAQDGQATENV